MLCMNAYSGCTVCAPARTCLMTGKHMGHASVRANPGGVSLQESDFTIAQMLKEAGYTCAGFGKWGIADLDTPGVPEKHGFDRFFGYYHQVHAHEYYPDYLIDTGKKVPLPGNQGFYTSDKPKPGVFPDADPATGRKREFSAYRIKEEMLKWLRTQSASQPFFCYAPWTIPHGTLEMPVSDPAWQLYQDKPWSLNARLYATFVSMADRFAGEAMAVLKEKGLDRNTLVLFSSDNGAANTYEGALNSVGTLRGKKTEVYEGGLRIPFLMRYPGKVAAGSTTDLPFYFPDLMPTIADATGARPYLPKDIDGVSLWAELTTGRHTVDRNRTMYWEWNEDHFRLPYHVSRQAVRRGNWKIVRNDVRRPWELYDLAQDPGEQHDLAQAHPELVQPLDAWVKANRVDPPEQIEPSRPAGQKWR